VIPQIDDYYEPFTYDYQHLHSAPESKNQPTARPRSLMMVNGWTRLSGVQTGKNCLAANFQNVPATVTEKMQKEMYGQFENTFMMYLPRLCEHCLNPSCVATCPSGAIYKREEDGIVLIDQDKCRGWRLCISGCPYKKIYFNWKSGKSEKCIFCYPRIESGQPTVCSKPALGVSVISGIAVRRRPYRRSASTEHETDLYERQCDVFLNPNDPAVIEEALKQGIPTTSLAAQRSPVYKMAMDWKLALPLHPEYRTLPMVWYVPPLSPIQSVADAGGLPHNGNIACG
jgi:nitrate reductase beta subunit